jgi:hypothetical protein
MGSDHRADEHCANGTLVGRYVRVIHLPARHDAEAVRDGLPNEITSTHKVLSPR